MEYIYSQLEDTYVRIDKEKNEGFYIKDGKEEPIFSRHFGPDFFLSLTKNITKEEYESQLKQ